MTGRPVLVAVLASAMMGTMTGCSDREDQPTTHGSDPTSSSDDAMASALTRSRRAFVDSALGLRTAGYAPTFGYTQYSICSDDSAEWRVTANGRFDREPPIGSTRADVESIRDELTSVGWTPDDSETSPDGVRELSSHWIVTVTRHDLTINVSMYASQPYILMRVLGPCLPATPEQRQEYETAGDQRFAVPAASDSA
jgi:hypothetical protein